jgi:D-amino-acid oxidase
MPDLFRHAKPAELPAGRTHGWVFSSVIIDTPRYIEWLRQRFENAGGDIHQQEIATLDDLDGLIMNCAGVGANQIASDPTVYPIRGQVIRIANPGLEFATLDDENPAGLTYILPRFDDCILGGSSDADDWNLETDEELTQAILSRCSEVEPRVAGALVLDVRVGLRPGRPSIRVEREDRPNAVVVHNYGHAGNGFSTSWATARHAVRLLRA